ncbi:uncharacterized protein LOC109824653 isoform X2 [Asparagus officinalis]|uniref:uncharacterized protein LOC109824653 isoform X2 n=1 Tax=Asparagus officinalis TaxID=4686 RepID=UPI00098DFF5A|nr:uncharacterized protein LOC109824653 isoform X2 [Asparagus officinalis]
MACRTVIMRSAVLLSPCNRVAALSSSFSSASVFSRHRSRVRVFRSSVPLRCSSSSSNGENTPPPQQDGEQSPPQEVVLKAISVSKTEGRVAQTTNVIIGGTVTDDATNEWLELDQKVNSYPMVRGFTAIGTGGDDFVQAMVVAVESVLQEPIPKGQISQKVSSRGKYVSVNIGPIRVVSSEQVQAVYNAMRRDDRMKYFL